MDKMIKYDVIQQDAIQIIAGLNDNYSEQIRGFVARLGRLEERQQKLDFKAFEPFYDNRWRLPVDARHIITSQGILMSIKDNINMILESRTTCLNSGNLKIFEADYNRLEKAYYNLKVDVESFERLQQLEMQEK